jgi:3-hydroxyisobutyrate dehydrogenase-like beta-hydroxyacid dehydrogenase
MKAGFAGLGHLGAPMSRHLPAAGHPPAGNPSDDRG